MATKRAKTAEEPDALRYARRLQELIAELCVEAMSFAARSKAEETAHQWLGRADLDPDDPRSVDAVAEALLRALEIATFAPSFTGATAIDRLARRRKSADGEARTALEALKQASFRILRISSPERQGLHRVEDLATREAFSILADEIPAAAVGLSIAARLCPLPSGIFVIVGPLTPLDDGALEVAMGFARPGRGLANPERCAAAVYRHVVRHGALQIPGLNVFPETDDDPSLFELEGSELDLLAHEWARLASESEPSADSVKAARSLTSLQSLLEALASSISARRGEKNRLADAYSRLASIQIETLQRRFVAGFGGAAPLDLASSAIVQAIAQIGFPTMRASCSTGSDGWFLRQPALALNAATKTSLGSFSAFRRSAPKRLTKAAPSRKRSLRRTRSPNSSIAMACLSMKLSFETRPAKDLA